MRTGLLIAALVVATSSDAQTIDWQRYAANGGSVTVDFPTDVFRVDKGSSSIGSGRIFANSDGTANLTVYTLENRNRYSPAQFLRSHFRPPSDVSVTYRYANSRVLALSGYRGTSIWYSRCNFGGGTIRCVGLDYPRAEKRQWDAIVTRISNSLS